MFLPPIIMKVTILELLLPYVCLQLLSGITLGHENGPNVVTVKEGDDVILSCSPSTKESITSKVFDWIKDRQEQRQEVFMYEAGIHYNNGRSGQDKQFKGRVSHFPGELKSGNASIMIRNTTMEDSGVYTCVFPRLQPSQTFYIKLVVEYVFKDRSGEFRGAAPEPCISIVTVREDGVQLKCEVRGVFPQPKLHWQDSDENVLSAEEPQVSVRGGRYGVILQTTVTSTTTNRFRCVVKQEDIGHAVNTEIILPGKLFEDESSHGVGVFVAGLFSGALLVAAAWVLFEVTKWIIKRRKKGSPQGNGSTSSPSKEPLNSPV